MPRKRPIFATKIPIAEVPKNISAYTFDAPKMDLGPKYAHIRDGQIYLSAGLTRYMEEKWGIFTAVHTSTNAAESTVTIFKADPDKGEPVPVNRYGAQSSAQFSFFVPLGMLNLKPPKDRQFEVVPFEQPINNAPPAFVFEMKKRVSIPRNLEEESAEAAAATEQGAENEEAAESEADE